MQAVCFCIHVPPLQRSAWFGGCSGSRGGICIDTCGGCVLDFTEASGQIDVPLHAASAQLTGTCLRCPRHGVA